jgi:hypothetical protein
MSFPSLLTLPVLWGSLRQNLWSKRAEFQVSLSGDAGWIVVRYYPERSLLTRLDQSYPRIESKRRALPEEIAKFSALILAGEYEVDSVPF